VRAIHDFWRPNGNGGEERGCAAVRTPGHRIVHHVQAAADVVLSERLQLVEMLLHLRPGPMKHVRFDGGRVYQDFIGHQLRAVFQRHHAIGALAPRVCALVIRLRLVRRRRRRRILFDDVDVEHFQDRGVGISQPRQKIVPVVTMRVDTERRRVPSIILAVAYLGAADIPAPGAPDAEVHLRRVVPYWCRLFARLKDAQRDPYPRGETIARSAGTRMNE
jgi:hypothetical protein